MYGELAPWWPLLSAPSDYLEEATFYLQTLESAGRRPLETVLELGSGGGNNASHMSRHVRMVLVDRAPGMLQVSRALNPGCEHHLGDMRTVRLGREFDAVFIHDAICYLTTEAELRQTIETAAIHCRPGGAVLLAPDYVQETFRPGTDTGGHDAPDGRALRFLEWVWDPDAADTTYLADYAFLVRSADGSARVFHDRHVEGLFPRVVWLRLLEDAGFSARMVPFNHSELEPGQLEVFVGVKGGLT
jgi:SAM-dependent methyltransferase